MLQINKKLSKQELIEILEDVIATSDHQHLIEDIANRMESLLEGTYNLGFSNGAGELPF